MSASVTNESLGLLSANVVLGTLPFPSQASRRRRRMNYPPPSPQDLQSHLYHAFLDGKTADVALRISGSWRAVYHLHRVVLIQSVGTRPSLSLPALTFSRDFFARSSLQVLWKHRLSILQSQTKLTLHLMITI